MTHQSRLSAGEAARLAPAAAPADPLDQALTRMAEFGPALENGNFDHGPMAAEALEALGLSDRIKTYTQQHITRDGVRPAAKPVAPITAESWSNALGRPARYSDWLAFIEADLVRLGWRELARRWILRLTPGAATAAVHGLIRSAHAVRALERRDTPARQAELVRALASWASLYAPPPWPPIGAQGHLAPQAAFDALSPAAAALQAREGSISAGLAKAMNAPAFTQEAGEVDLSGPADALADAVLTVFIRAFLDYARSSYTAIVWCHAITGAMSVRRLFSIVTEEQARALLACVFEIGCAMKAAFADLHADRSPGSDALDTPDALAQRAVQTGDDHAIKLTDALLEAYRSSGSNAALRAADRGIRLLAS